MFPTASFLALALLAAPAPAAAPTTTAAAPKAADRPLTDLPYTPSLDLAAMDRAIDPCVDFYQYVCGGWMKANPIPADKPSWSVYGKLTVENERFLWGILEDSAKPRADRSPTQQKIGDLFASCIDEPAVEKVGATPLAADLAAIDGLASVKEMAPLVARMLLQTAESSVIFGFTASQDYADSSQEIADASAGGLGLPDRDFYVKTDPKSVEFRTKYLVHVQKMLELSGTVPELAAAAAKTIMAMETDLAKASLTLTDKRDTYKIFHKMGLKDLKKLTPSFDWDAFLTALGTSSVLVLNVQEPAFFKQVEVSLKKVPLADWKSYLRWHLVHGQAPFLSSALVNEDFEFNKHTLRGVEQLKPRWERCVSYADYFLGEALGQEFVRRTFTPETKQRAQVMMKLIKQAMEQEVKGLDWMGAQTKQKAQEKLKAMVDKIGYPEKWRDYTALEVKRGDFYGDMSRAIVFESRRVLAKIGKPVDRLEWGMTPPTVNAYYDPQKNDMNFPSGVLQPPLFDAKLDDAPNYGNTGSTIGHELTHGFDDEGRQFDAKGNLHDWWTKQDAAAFEKRTKCIVDQYAQYVVVDEVKINSKLSLGEDLADLGGTQLAWMAWKEATKAEKLESRDGLTPDQRFFVGLGQWACENERPENLRFNAATNPHSPGRYRINGVVANLPEFQAAFSCKKGQPMVREQRCRVW